MPLVRCKYCSGMEQQVTCGGIARIAAAQHVHRSRKESTMSRSSFSLSGLNWSDLRIKRRHKQRCKLQSQAALLTAGYPRMATGRCESTRT
jgi:hypothetical protein